MPGLYQSVLFPALSRSDPERVHAVALALLSLFDRSPGARRVLRGRFALSDPRLTVEAFGLRFPNPVGLAAGFDKDGRAVRSLAALGFGHVEVGTVTPSPQSGQPRPRLFRLEQDRALINRLGFPSRGVDFMRRSLPPKPREIVLGVNVGPNAATVRAGNAEEDCARCIAELAEAADYFTLNVSSPNTPGLRDLQRRQQLDALLAATFDALQRTGVQVPILVKLSPDLSEDDLSEAIEVLTSHPLAGIVATNTTLARPETLRSANKFEAGGLSGEPLHSRSTELVRRIFEHTGGSLPIVAVGGMFTADDALEKLAAGASLVQLYTGLIYQGPSVARDINLGLLAYLDRNGLSSISELVGRPVGGLLGAG